MAVEIKNDKLVITIDNTFSPGEYLEYCRHSLYSLIANYQGEDNTPVYFVVELLRDMELTPEQLQQALKPCSNTGNFV